jgi:hypothetical protein
MGRIETMTTVRMEIPLFPDKDMMSDLADKHKLTGKVRALFRFALPYVRVTADVDVDTGEIKFIKTNYGNFKVLKHD